MREQQDWLSDSRLGTCTARHGSNHGHGHGHRCTTEPPYPVSNGFSCRLANKNGSIPRCSTEVLLQGSPAMQIKECTTAMRALQDEAGQICPGRDAGGNGWLALLSWRQSGKEEGSGVDANGTCLVTWSDCCVSRYSTVCLISPLENLVLPTPSERSGRESRYS